MDLVRQPLIVTGSVDENGNTKVLNIEGEHGFVGIWHRLYRVLLYRLIVKLSSRPNRERRFVYSFVACMPFGVSGFTPEVGPTKYAPKISHSLARRRRRAGEGRERGDAPRSSRSFGFAPLEPHSSCRKAGGTDLSTGIVPGRARSDNRERAAPRG